MLKGTPVKKCHPGHRRKMRLTSDRGGGGEGWGPLGSHVQVHLSQQSPADGFRFSPKRSPNMPGGCATTIAFSENIFYKLWSALQMWSVPQGRERAMFILLHENWDIPPLPHVWGRMDTCICMAESLHCSPGTITTLFIGYTPIQNVLVLKKESWSCDFYPSFCWCRAPHWLICKC